MMCPVLTGALPASGGDRPAHRRFVLFRISPVKEMRGIAVTILGSGRRLTEH